MWGASAVSHRARGFTGSDRWWWWWWWWWSVQRQMPRCVGEIHRHTPDETARQGQLHTDVDTDTATLLHECSICDWTRSSRSCRWVQVPRCLKPRFLLSSGLHWKKKLHEKRVTVSCNSLTFHNMILRGMGFLSSLLSSICPV